MADIITFNPITDSKREDEEVIDTINPTVTSTGRELKTVPTSWENTTYDAAAEAEENDTWHQIKGYGAGAIVEMGGGFYMSHKLNSAGRYQQTVSNSKKILNSLRALRVANAATWQKSFTPWGAVAQVGTFAVTEAGIWALANLAGQGTRNAMGVQEGIHSSELISSAVFGTIAQPVESAFALAKIGDKINKAMPLKIVAETTHNAKKGVVDLAAWKGRELLVKGTPKFVSGAVLGLTESVMRQELALQMNEIEERNGWDYATSTLAGGGLNSVFGVFSKSGAWGRKQATTVAERARDRTKQAIEDINKDIEKLGQNINKPSKNKKLNDLTIKKGEHEQALEILEDMVEDIKKADAHVSVDETTPSTAIDQPEPAILREKRERLENQETLDTDEPKETINLDKALDESTLDRLLRELEEKWQTAVDNLDEGSVTDEITRITKKIYEAADYDMGVAIEKLALMGDDIDMPTIARLLEDVETQIKLLDSVHGRINTAAGRAVRANNLNSSPAPNSTYSLANQQTKDALNVIKRRLRSVIDGTDTIDDFIAAADKVLEGKKLTTKPADVDTPPTPKPEGDIPSQLDYTNSKVGDTIEIVGVDGKRSQVEIIGISEQSGQIKFKRKDGSEGLVGMAKDSVLTDINSPDYVLQAAGHGTRRKNIKDLSDADLDTLEASLKKSFKETPALKNADGEAANREHISDLFAIKLERARRTGEAPEAPATPKETPEATPTPKDAPQPRGEESPNNKNGNKDEEIDSGSNADVDEPEISPIVSALDKRIAKLQKQLDELLPNISGRSPEEAKGSKGNKKAEDPEVKRLKENIANAKRYKREAERVVKEELEVARLAEIAARNDPAEMQLEVGGKGNKPKESLNKKINEAKARQRAAKKLFRERLKKIIDDEKKQIRLEAKAKLWDDVYDYVYREAEMENAGFGVKLFRTARILRKLGMVNSPTSAMAALPTGAFEMIKLFPKAYIAKAMAKTDLEAQAAAFELEAAGEAMMGLFKADTWKHFYRAYKTGQDPSYGSSTRFGDDFKMSAAREITPLGLDGVVTNARQTAQRAAYGQDATIAWANEKLALGKLLPFLSWGARSIIGVDATFKRQLRFAAARAESRKKALLNHPNDPAKAQEYSDKLLNSWLRDANGFKVLAQVDELADDFARIDDALLMASHGDLEDVAQNLTEQILIKPISGMLNDDRDGKRMVVGAIIELFMPFYKVGVRSVVKSATLANPLRVLGASKMDIPAVGNPYIGIKKQLTNKRKDIIAKLEAGRPTESKKWIRDKELELINLENRIKRAEYRRINHNKEVLTDVVIQLSLGSAAFAAGYMGKATGTNAWMTADQKRKNKDKVKDFTMFGMDYRAAVPVNLLMAFSADLGRYMRAKKNNQLSDDLSGLTLILESLKTASRELPTSQGLTDLDGLFSGSNERFSAMVSKVAASYLLPVPSWVRKVTSYATAQDTISELKGGTFSDRIMYYSFGKATPNRKVDIAGQFVTNDRTIHHTWNRFASPKEIERKPYQNVIASDHEQVLDASLDAGFYVEGNMHEWRDESGVTLHQHFAERLRQSTLEMELNTYAVGQYLNDVQLDIPNDKGTPRNKGILNFGKILNQKHKEIKEMMREDASLLSRFVNKENENLQDKMLELQFQGDEILNTEIPKPIF